MSETSLLGAMLALQAEAPKLHRDATNPHFRNRYASLDGIVETVNPLLQKCGLVWTTLPVSDEHGQPALYYRLAHAESGEQIAGTMPLLLTKNDSQGMGSAITYARRYSLCAVLNLVADEDDDGNEASSGPTGRVSSSAPPSEKQLDFLKSLVKRNNPGEQVLRAMLKAVDADGVDPTAAGWSKALKRDQVSQLIEIFKSGSLPTGTSDIPSDAGEFKVPAISPDDNPVPFDA